MHQDDDEGDKSVKLCIPIDTHKMDILDRER